MTMLSRMEARLCYTDVAAVKTWKELNRFKRQKKLLLFLASIITKYLLLATDHYSCG